MDPDPRQIERLRYDIRTIRQYVFRALSEIEDQLNEIAGEVPEGQGSWKVENDELVQEITGKK